MQIYTLFYYLCRKLHKEIMKRKLISAIIIIAALVCVSNASAQFRYGPMVGVDVTNLNFKQDLMTVDKSVGYSAGVVAEMMFPGIGFGIDLGLYYEQRGATLHLGEKAMWADQGYGVDRSYLHYAVIPVHLRFKYTRLNGFEDKLAPIVFAGPSFGFLVGHSDIDCMKYAAGELGVDFGLGVEIMRNWQVTASYNHGFTYALKDKTLTNFSARNTTWSVRVAYLF